MILNHFYRYHLDLKGAIIDHLFRHTDRQTHTDTHNCVCGQQSFFYKSFLEGDWQGYAIKLFIKLF